MAGAGTSMVAATIGWPRQDGSYAAFVDPVWEYLRFFPSQLVASVSSLLPPEVFAARIELGNEAIAYGVATVGDGSLTVTTRNEEGAVSFSIRMPSANQLHVESHSHVNDARFSTRYDFFPA